MITLLELLLNKKYKNILEYHINNIPLPISTLEQIVEDNDSGDDDDWDKEDFEPVKTIHTSEIIINSTIINLEPIVENDKKKDDDKTEEIPDDWDSI